MSTASAFANATSCIRQATFRLLADLTDFFSEVCEKLAQGRSWEAGGGFTQFSQIGLVVVVNGLEKVVDRLQVLDEAIGSVSRRLH